MAAAQNALPPPPNDFGHGLEEWIYNQFSSSVFAVQFVPRDPDAVLARWNAVLPLDNGDVVGQQERQRRCGDTQCATGFKVRDANDLICILTCAHVLGPAYSNQNPITVDLIEALFQPRILCDHREERYKWHLDHQRVYLDAQVTHIRCRSDLMLLTVPRNEFVVYCNHLHRTIPMAPDYPAPLNTVVMLSWPPFSHRTAARGRTSHLGRHISTLATENREGYMVRLAEVDVAADPGSSGAPLLNGAGQFVAALHGRCGKGFSYFISFRDLHAVLRAWGMVD